MSTYRNFGGFVVDSHLSRFSTSWSDLRKRWRRTPRCPRYRGKVSRDPPTSLFFDLFFSHASSLTCMIDSDLTCSALVWAFAAPASSSHTCHYGHKQISWGCRVVSCLSLLSKGGRLRQRHVTYLRQYLLLQRIQQFHLNTIGNASITCKQNRCCFGKFRKFIILFSGKNKQSQANLVSESFSRISYLSFVSLVRMQCLSAPGSSPVDGWREYGTTHAASLLLFTVLS
jgi:hypothetical protein